VAVAERVPSASGPLVCRFTLVGLPGHYRASRHVAFLATRGFRSLQLAAPAPRAPRAPRARAAAAGGAGRRGTKRAAGGAPRAPAPALTREQRLAAIRRQPHLVAEDIAGGVEGLPVPVFNDTGDGEVLPPDLQYLALSEAASPAAAAMAAEALAVMPGGGRWCGLPRGRGGAAYTPGGLLACTEYLGVWECCGEACGAAGCAANRVVTAGARPPLEVFRTRGRGWGVRSAEALPAGRVVCTYEGELITSAEAVSVGKKQRRPRGSALSRDAPAAQNSAPRSNSFKLGW
jgi:euchromatic histone-lysine N-methyltransferase